MTTRPGWIGRRRNGGYKSSSNPSFTLICPLLHLCVHFLLLLPLLLVHHLHPHPHQAATSSSLITSKTRRNCVLNLLLLNVKALALYPLILFPHHYQCILLSDFCCFILLYTPDSLALYQRFWIWSHATVLGTCCENLVLDPVWTNSKLEK